MNKFLNTNKTKLTVLVLFAFGIFSILFLSWKADPNLKELLFIPDWLSNWTDQMRNSRRRTAVPFIGLGLLAALYIIYIERTAMVFWFSTWLILVMIACLAEAGQYFLPARSVDIKDIIWGGIGAGIGLLVPYFVWQLVRRFKTIKFDKKNN